MEHRGGSFLFSFTRLLLATTGYWYWYSRSAFTRPLFRIMHTTSTSPYTTYCPLVSGLTRGAIIIKMPGGVRVGVGAQLAPQVKCRP